MQAPDSGGVPSIRPIVSGTSIPTHDELAKVSSALGDDAHLKVVESVSAQISSSIQEIPPYLREAFNEASPITTLDADRKDGLILTRAERQLVKGNLPLQALRTSTSMACSFQDEFEASPFEHSGEEADLLHYKSERLAQQPDQITNGKRRADDTFEEITLSQSKHRRVDHDSDDSLNVSNPSSEQSADDQPLDQPSASLHAIGRTSALLPASINAPMSSFTNFLPTGNLNQAGPASLPQTLQTLLIRKNVSLAIKDFRRLKGDLSTHSEDPTLPPEEPTDVSTPSSPRHEKSSTSLKPPPPKALNNAFNLPSSWAPPFSEHHYMASLHLIQKRTLATYLSSPALGYIDLIEHSMLQNDDVPDLILDPNAAIIFVPLLHLPSETRELMKRLQTLCKSFSSLLLIFEAYPPSQSFGSMKTTQKKAGHRQDSRKNLNVPAAETISVDVFSPPVVLALKRFRRELAIERELLDDASMGWNVQVVCALSVQEAAMYARSWGDRVETSCDNRLRKMLWGDRNWLMQDESEVRKLIVIPGCTF